MVPKSDHRFAGGAKSGGVLVPARPPMGCFSGGIPQTPARGSAPWIPDSDQLPVRRSLGVLGRTPVARPCKGSAPWIPDSDQPPVRRSLGVLARTPVARPCKGSAPWVPDSDQPPMRRSPRGVGTNAGCSAPQGLRPLEPQLCLLHRHMFVRGSWRGRRIRNASRVLPSDPQPNVGT